MILLDPAIIPMKTKKASHIDIQIDFIMILIKFIFQIPFRQLEGFFLFFPIGDKRKSS